MYANDVLLKSVLDTRRPKANGKFPVKLRLTFNRKQKYYPLNLDLSPEVWELVSKDKVKKDLKPFKNYILEAEAKAILIIKKLEAFSFNAFEASFYANKSNDGEVADAFYKTIAKLNNEEKVSTAISYNASLNSLKLYKQHLRFTDISSDFLKSYEKWMLSQDNSITTVGIYLRALRAIYNIAIDEGKANRANYPFGKRKYIIPSGRNIKKALSKRQLLQIMNYKPVPMSQEDKARDFWVFTYLCNGINMKDIANLKFSDIHGEFIHFIRAKTQDTTKGNQKPITFYLRNEVKDIIKKWGKSKSKAEKSDYIFSIIDDKMTAKKKYAAIQQFIKIVNKYINVIADNLEIDKRITTYTARHTFSTILKQSGASVEFIQESLGHSDKKTTENYLASFENETIKQYSDKLL